MMSGLIRVILPIAAASLGYALSWCANVVQIMCYHGWSLAVFLDDYVTGGPLANDGNGSSIAYRLRPDMGLAERWESVTTWAPTFYREAVVGEYREWVTWQFFYLLVACAALVRPSRWSVVGALLVVASFPVIYDFVLVATIKFHPHSMPRIVITTMLLAVACLAVEERNVPA